MATKNKTKKQNETTTATTTTTNQCWQSRKSFSRRKECSQNSGKIFFEMLQEDSYSSQAADYKSETQLKPRRPTDILQKRHLDLEFYLNVLEIHEHMFFKKLASKGCFLKKKKNNQKKNTKQEQKQKQNNSNNNNNNNNNDKP